MSFSLSLRSKIVLLAVASSIVVLVVGAAGTWLMLRHVAVRELDARLNTDAKELFRDFDNFTGGPRDQRAEFTERFIPLALRERWIELAGRHGELLYRSESLGDTTLAGAPPGFSNREIDGQPVRVGVFESEEMRLYIAADLGEIRRFERNLGMAFLLALPVVGLSLALTGRWLAHRALQPIDEVTRAAGQITAARLDLRLPEPAARDEIHRLVAVLNATFERLERSFEQAVRFSADASHQLKTPLSVLRVGLDALLHSPKCDGAEKDAVNELLDQVRRLTSLTEDLLLLARVDAGRLELRRVPCDLRHVFDECLDDARTIAEGRGITLEASLPARIEAEADPGRVTIILQNLLENAVKYNRAGGRLCLCVKVTPPWLEVIVGNSGEPIAPERRAHIFERFSRGLSDERIAGTGLGLSLARELARAHGGELELSESADDWIGFTLRLPVVAR